MPMPQSLEELAKAGLDVVELLNAHKGGFNDALGLAFTKATADEVCATLEIGDHLRQPYGIVHGGVYASMVETLASTAAAINAMPQGRSTVGLDNSTTFLRATRQGTLHGTATPLHKGRRTHVWEVKILDDDGRVCAQGRVRLLCVETGSEIAGERVGERFEDVIPKE